MQHPQTIQPSSNAAGFFGGLLALLLVCGAALLGGLPENGHKSARAPSLWHSGAEVPLFNTAAYPKDCKRNSDPRGRQGPAGDDQPDLDPSAALCNPYPQIAQAARMARPAAAAEDIVAHSPHRPQAARAPPLA